MLTAVDIVVIVLLVGGAILGWIKGFVTEVLSLFAWVAAIFALKMLHAPASDLLLRVVGSHGGAAVLAFVLVFGVTFILGRVLAGALGRRTRQSVMGTPDRLAGLSFGAVKGLLIATVLFLGGNLMIDMWYGQAAARPTWLAQSRTYPLLATSGRAVVDFVRIRRGQAHPDGVRFSNAQGRGAV